ncbi:MAG: hypothetical protein Q9214_002748 [Letrouitia sp. 1 TL-2023]
MKTLDSDCKEAIEENMNEWQLRRRGGGSLYDPAASGTAREGNINIPLSQGEWDEPLGLPMCVVCHGIDKIDTLEKEQSWKEEEFDFVLQYLRTILLKHGASLIYTSNSAPNSLPLLIHSSLGIHSLLKRDTFRHNIIDREKIIVPPNWDSWGKIRVLREGFDVEAISKGWSIDIQQPPAEPSSSGNEDQSPSSDADNPTRTENAARPQTPKQHGAVLQIYEETILNPDKDQPSTAPPVGEVKPDLSVPSMQDFLKTQLEAITKSNEQDQKNFTKDSATTSPSSSSSPPSNSITETDGRVNQHIGPVQFNMGGIQVDADDMVKKLKERGQTAVAAPGTPEGTKAQDEELASFFAGLMKRTRDSPRVGSGTPSKEPRS